MEHFGYNVGWGKSFKSITSAVSNAVSSVTNAAQTVTASVQNVVSDLKGTIDSAGNLVQDAASLMSPIVTAVDEVMDEVNKAEDFYNAQVAPWIYAFKPLFKPIDSYLSESVYFGDIYNAGIETVAMTKGIAQTMQNYYEMVKGDIPEQAAAFVDEMIDNIEQFFKFLGWD